MILILGFFQIIERIEKNLQDHSVLVIVSALLVTSIAFALSYKDKEYWKLKSIYTSLQAIPPNVYPIFQTKFNGVLEGKFTRSSWLFRFYTSMHFLCQFKFFYWLFEFSNSIFLFLITFVLFGILSTLLGAECIGCVVIVTVILLLFIGNSIFLFMFHLQSHLIPIYTRALNRLEQQTTDFVTARKLADIREKYFHPSSLSPIP